MCQHMMMSVYAHGDWRLTEMQPLCNSMNMLLENKLNHGDEHEWWSKGGF